MHQLSQPEIGHIDTTRTGKDADGTSHISALRYSAYKSQNDLDALLLANGYTAAQVGKLTTNDKIYAIRSIANPVAPIAVPDITDIIPLGAAIGTRVTIVGTGLAGVSAVTVKAVAATITQQTDLFIVITIPAGSAGAGNVVVTAPGGSDSFAYTAV